MAELDISEQSGRIGSTILNSRIEQESISEQDSISQQTGRAAVFVSQIEEGSTYVIVYCKLHIGCA